jgi:hypothetical protein
MSFYEQLEKFSHRMVKAEPLAKSTTPSDFRGLVRALDPHGSEVVDHSPHLSGHPPEHQPTVDLYNSVINPSTPVFKRHKRNIEGVTKKIVYSMPKHGDPSKTDLFLIKPYHERVTRPARPWMHHAIQGWAEMTNQGLWHAAGIGHMHQKAHVALHNMGPGHEAEPAVVIAMHPAAKMLTAMHPQNDPYGQEAAKHWDPSMLSDVVKIGAMDFLTNNIDRHEHNLMYIPSDYTENGLTPKSRLLAIDHGRNFQYKSSIKGMPRYVLENGIKRPIEPWERPDPNIDNLQNYVVGRANKFVMRVGKHLGYMLPTSLHIMQQIGQWWPKVEHEVVNEFEQHLRSIKNPAVREHLKKNFMERVNMLNYVSHHPNEVGKIRNTDVPVHPFESSNLR